MSFILLLLIALAVYVLWFRQFKMPDGTIVKGWLAKNKAEAGNNPRVFVAEEEDNPVAEEPAPQDSELPIPQTEDQPEDQPEKPAETTPDPQPEKKPKLSKMGMKKPKKVESH